jgi:hypothetical protein
VERPAHLAGAGLRAEGRGDDVVAALRRQRVQALVYLMFRGGCVIGRSRSTKAI